MNILRDLKRKITNMPQDIGLQILTNNYIEKDAAISQLDKDKAVRALIKDISSLLNSKSSDMNIGNIENPLDSFITNYGLPELSYYSPYSVQDQEIVSNLIKDCLEKFEPRLNNISVIAVPQSDNAAFHFKIKAIVRLEIETLTLIFDSKINTISKKIILRKGN